MSNTVHAAGHCIEILDSRVLVDGMVRPMSPAGMATLWALARQPGNVIARDDLLHALPGKGSDTHAVEAAILRLRAALGDKDIVTTVIKRGYRLAVDAHSEST